MDAFELKVMTWQRRWQVYYDHNIECRCHTCVVCIQTFHPGGPFEQAAKVARMQSHRRPYKP